MKHREAKLQNSSDYRMFMPSEENRDVEKTKLLEESMRRFGFDPAYPIRCVRSKNGKLIIRSGHRRFYVAQMLNLPIYYVVSDNDLSLFDEQRSMDPWNLKAYVTAYSRSGHEDINKLRIYAQKTGIPLAMAASLLGGVIASGGATNKVVTGNFRITDNDTAAEVAKIVAMLEEMGVQFCKHTSFLKALLMMLLTPGFDAEIFIRKARTHIMLFEKCRDVEAYLFLLDTIMNYQTPTKKREAWVHLSKIAAKQRCISSPDSTTRYGRRTKRDRTTTH